MSSTPFALRPPVKRPGGEMNQEMSLVVPPIFGSAPGYP